MNFITTKCLEILSSGFGEVALKKKGLTDVGPTGQSATCCVKYGVAQANVDFPAYRIYHKIMNIHNKIYCTPTHASQITSDISQDYRIFITRY